jgi:hypothetical protein
MAVAVMTVGVPMARGAGRRVYAARAAEPPDTDDKTIAPQMQEEC